MCLKIGINVLSNRLRKSIDLVYHEYNTLFKSKYGTVYMNILKEFSSACSITTADIRTLRNYFDITTREQRISLIAEELKAKLKILLILNHLQKKCKSNI